MEQFRTSFDGHSILVEDIADAEKLVTLSSKKAFRLAHIAKHRADLEFTRSLLERIPQINQADGIMLKAFWEYAVVSYVKCFIGGSRRSQLDVSHILKEDADGIVAHNYFINVRNKNLIHDENLLSQAFPTAAINNGKKSYKIERVLVMSIDGLTFAPENHSNLMLLVNKSLEWIIMKFNELCRDITNELEQITYEQLSSMPSVSYTVPSVDDISKRRTGP